MSQAELRSSRPRNPYALPARQRGRRLLKDRRQGRGGARDWLRCWLSAYLDEQFTAAEEASS